MPSDQSAQIILKENRDAEGVDRFVPQVLINGALYDNELDRFFLDLPLNGVRSPHSLRAFGYDIVVWIRFLAHTQSKGVWDAEYSDVVSSSRPPPAGSVIQSFSGDLESLCRFAR